MKHRSILLIEDNESDIELAERALARNHISNQLVVMTDGQAALDYLFAEGPHAGRNLDEQPSITLLDLKLPKVDGIEVLRRLRADPRTHRLPIVVLTSSREDQDLAASYDLGVNSYIRKPVDFHQFSEAIRQLGLYWLVLNEQPPPTRE